MYGWMDVGGQICMHGWMDIGRLYKCMYVCPQYIHTECTYWQYVF